MTTSKRGLKPRDFLPGYNFFEYLLLRIAVALVNILPMHVSHWIAKKVGDLLFLILPKRRKVALSNLDIAFRNSKSRAQKEAIAKESFRNLATSLVEFFSIPKFLKKSEHHFRFEGTEYLDRAFLRGRGIVLVTSHLGSWEYLAFLPYLKKYLFSVVGRPVKNPYLYKWIESLRRRTTLNHIDKNKAVRPIFSELRKNRVVGILIDQWAGSEGLWLDFFGEATSTTSIPVRLAKKTGCALIPAYCLRLGSGNYEIQIKPEIAIQGNEDNWEEKTTQKLNDLLGEQILKYPEQWIWTHKRWKGLKHYQGLKE